MDKIIQEGDTVLIKDAKGRERLVKVSKHKTFYAYGRHTPHERLVGIPLNSVIYIEGKPIYILSALTGDYIVNMKRAVQPIYPKDLGVLTFYADLCAGMKVLEIGLGAGALSSAILRVIGKDGRLVTYERREEFIPAAKAFINKAVPWQVDERNHTVITQDAMEGIEEKDFDACFIDIPEPWTVVENVLSCLKSGAPVLIWLPTTPQVKQICDSLRGRNDIIPPIIFETLQRPWDESQRSLRPAHFMVGHTGFIIMTRKVIAYEQPQ